MPFGHCNVPGTFQRLMERVLSGLHWTSCLVYLDDIIVFSQSIADHLQKLREVFVRFQEAGLKIKPSAKKCPLPWTCGIIKGSTDRPKESQLRPRVAKDVKELRQFLGMTSYYRQFIKSFALKASPPYRFTEKERRWE